MNDTLTYKYQMSSYVEDASDNTSTENQKASSTPFSCRSLILSDYSEIRQPAHYFFGQITNPFILSRCLQVLSSTVQSDFSLNSFGLIKDPIITVGNATIRFEGFSNCAGVYVRTDVYSGGFRGEILASGTTNVDFNQPMLSALGGITRADDMGLSIGHQSVRMNTKDKTVTERQVPLPSKWIKGLASVQYYLAQSQLRYSLNKLQALQLFRSIPKGKSNADYFIIKRANKYQFSPVNASDNTTNHSESIVVGGPQRLQLLSAILPYIDHLKIFAPASLNTDANNQSVTFQLYFGAIVLSFTLSRTPYRGFSGEGALLEALLEDIPYELIEQVNKRCVANQVFSDTSLVMSANTNGSKIDSAITNNLTAKLSAMGLLGFGLDDGCYFYRQLPFKLNRILALNPRLKGVEKLLENNQVHIVSNDGSRVEAQVAGTGVTHTVMLNSGYKQNARESNNSDKQNSSPALCTCLWHSQNQGERGDCKHILAVKKYLK